jgi:lipopolysaccharide transport system permease protein
MQSTLRYIELALYKTYAELRAESARTYAGVLWWIIDPAIQMVIYYVVFGIFFNHRTENYVPFLLVGLVVWRWLHSALMEGSNAIILAKDLVRQVYLPKILLPTVVVLANTAKFALSFVLLLVVLRLFGLPCGIAYAALPVLLAVEMLLILASTYFFAALAPFLPDIRIILDNALRTLVFISGVFFSGHMIPEQFRPYFYLNPMAVLIESFRDVLLDNRWPAWSAILTVGALSLLGTALSAALVARNEYVYPKL